MLFRSEEKYLNAPKGTKLYARATCRKNGRQTIVINVDVTDDTGRDIAQFIGSGFKLQTYPMKEYGSINLLKEGKNEK